MEDLVKTILQKMSTVKKPQQVFMASLFSVFMVFQGKATFKNMSRYCDMSEKRFGRWFRRRFNFSEFNLKIMDAHFPEKNERIAVIDASFIKKAGKKTEGLAWFYNGCAGEAQKGLEASMICVVDLKLNTAHAIEAEQTIDKENLSRVDLYANQVIRLAPMLLEKNIRHIAADAYYSKVKFIAPVVKSGLHLVGKLRVDADLMWLYEGENKGRGRPKKYEGKVDFNKDLHRFDKIETLKDGVEVYASTVFSRRFSCPIKLVMMRWYRNGKLGMALLYSTDVNLEASVLVKYYKARFQIEFVFRDAKQFTGFGHCQSCRKEAINMHLNASLTTLNLLKIEDRSYKNSEEQTVISIASWKRKKYNQHFIKVFLSNLGFSLKSEKISEAYEASSNYGIIAA